MGKIKVARTILDWEDFEMLRGTALAQQMLRNKVVATTIRDIDNDLLTPKVTAWVLEQCSGLVAMRDITQNNLSRYGIGDRRMFLYFEHDAELAAFKLRWHGYDLYDGPGG